MQRSPRIADIGIAPAPEGNKANASGAGIDPGVDSGKAGGDVLGYYGASEGAGIIAAAPNGGDPAVNGMGRELWQETDTMYDNLPFDPAYRTFLRSFINAKTLSLFTLSVRLGSSQPRIRHALLNVCRFRDRHDSNATFELYGPTTLHARQRLARKCTTWSGSTAFSTTHGASPGYSATAANGDNTAFRQWKWRRCGCGIG